MQHPIFVGLCTSDMWRIFLEGRRPMSRRVAHFPPYSFDAVRWSASSERTAGIGVVRPHDKRRVLPPLGG